MPVGKDDDSKGCPMAIGVQVALVPVRASIDVTTSFVETARR